MILVNKINTKMAYWLIKSEPDSYSWQQMQQDVITAWDGVRNYQARNNLRAMIVGDVAFFYHSNKERIIKGTVEVVREYYTDPSDKTERFGIVDVKFQKSLVSSISLAFIKNHPQLQNMALVKQSRLSVMPVSALHFQLITDISNALTAI